MDEIAKMPRRSCPGIPHKAHHRQDLGREMVMREPFVVVRTGRFLRIITQVSFFYLMRMITVVDMH